MSPNIPNYDTDEFQTFKASQELARDVEYAWTQVIESGDERNRRAYVRALFAWYEAIAFAIRMNVLQINALKKMHSIEVDQTHNYLLKEKHPRIGKNGKVQMVAHRVAFSDHFAFSIRSMLALKGLDNDQIFNQLGWKHFLKSIELRDRLTHPKRVKDIEVNENDLDECNQAYVWVASLLREAYDAPIKLEE